MVQIGVPLQSRELYGKPQFLPLWEAAADAGLPVAVHIETGTGIGVRADAVRPPADLPAVRSASWALNYLYHLMNMIAEGVFERLPDLKFVWADGGADLLTPFIWRMDTFGRPHLEQTPWAPQMPSDYLPGHVYFVQGSLDGPGDGTSPASGSGSPARKTWSCSARATRTGSMQRAEHAARGLTAEQRREVLWRNAAELYGLDVSARRRLVQSSPRRRRERQESMTCD